MKLCREALLIRMSRAESRQWLISTQSSLSCHPHSARVTLNWRPQRALCVSTSEMRTAGDNESSPRSFTMVGRVQCSATQGGGATAVHPPVTPHSHMSLHFTCTRHGQSSSRLLGFPLRADHFCFFFGRILTIAAPQRSQVSRCSGRNKLKRTMRVVNAAAATDD